MAAPDIAQGNVTSSSITGTAASGSTSWPIILALTALSAYLYRSWTTSRRRSTYSLHPLVPSFISGIYASIQLGVNETSFLLSLRETYGGMVYLPFPLGQYFILSDKIVRQIYNGTYNKQLSFIPIRKEMSGTVFGMKKSQWQSENMEKRIFPTHSKSMVKSKLQNAVARFSSVVEETLKVEVEAVRSAPSASKTLDLVEWTYGIMFRASMAALFGTELEHSIPMEQFMSSFKNFDDSFPLLASGLIPLRLQPYFPTGVAAGTKARDEMNLLFGRWARETSCSGLEKGDVVKDMADEGLALNWSDYDLGSTLTADFWALLANNPFAACWSMIYLIQADEQLFDEILAEIDDIPENTPASQADLPLLTSCFFETLRLQSSSFSIRVCQEQAVLGENTIVTPGEKVVCITRVGHLDTEVWGEDAREWDGRRFYDDPKSSRAEMEQGSKAKKIPFVRAFGGGVSICEGRNLAMAEVKSFLVPVLRTFQFKITEATLARTPGAVETRSLASGQQIYLPKPLPGRPGLGIMQFSSGMFAEMTLRD